MEAAVQVPLVRREFGRAYGTDIFEDWRTLPSFKVRFETAFWLEPFATAAGIIADGQRQPQKKRPNQLIE
ncbi:hypothetical protein [Lactiplantibacillus fabifermentans]|uniref:Uncharacterized protein n=2 Tax=Lactiplantibacillus fabifermentans TaxID=483011 RepID=A0A0R2NGY8_9LACO|nr:hypothetical protein [Lactiplantibacillus fabifermentans]ETY75428.1 hypothetical protein LFAB_02070 [Lactiplantibacillus fabifermentans T30PCM01]KRO25060.1 hypothetical protein DY78_GL001416 [Lactiplantibacillus fabifermentans DSM 21115]